MATTTTAPTKAAPAAPTPVAPAAPAAVPAWLQNPRVLGGVLGGIALVAAAVWFVN